MSTSTSPPNFSISKETLNLFSQWSGITNESELRDHVIAIQQKATAARPYRCISEFRFIQLRAKTHPFYATAVSDFITQTQTTTTTQRQPQLCDLGCAMGTDLRQFVMDGVPPSAATGIDISEELISIGFELFREDRGLKRYPITWVVADVLSADGGIKVLSADGGSNVVSGGGGSNVVSGDGGIKVLSGDGGSNVVSGDGSGHHKNKLGPLSHYSEFFDLIYTGAVIHLFPQDTVKKFLFHAIQMLRPHGTILGRNIGASDYPFVVDRKGREPSLGPSFGYLHTKDSIKELLEELGLVMVETWVLENRDNWANRENFSEQRKQMILLCWKGVKPGKCLL